MRIAYLNSYLSNVADSDLLHPTLDHPLHHFWGADVLRQRGHEIIWLELNSKSLLGRAADKLTRIHRGRLGNLEVDLRTLHAAAAADVLYLPVANIMALPLLRAVRAIKTPVVTWIYAPPPDAPAWRPTSWRHQPPYLRGLDGLMCLTSAAEAFFKPRMPHALVETVDWCGDPRYAEAGIRYEPFALCAGRTNRDYATLVAAAPYVRGQVRLICPPEAVAGLALPKNLQLIAASSPTQPFLVTYRDLMQQHYAAARCIVIPLVPNPLETAGLTNLMEAMHMGKPSVTTRTGCLDVDVDALRIGRSVPAKDPRAMADAINAYLDDEAAARAAGARAKALADERFSPERFGASVERFLAEVVQRTGR